MVAGWGPIWTGRDIFICWDPSNLPNKKHPTNKGAVAGSSEKYTAILLLVLKLGKQRDHCVFSLKSAMQLMKLKLL